MLQIHNPDVVLTNTLSRSSIPVAAELADTARHPPALISSIAVVFTSCSIVIPIRGAGEVAMQRWREFRTSFHWKKNKVEINRANF